MDDFFAELEADIAKSLANDKLKKDREAARKKANTMTLSSAARAKALEEYREASKLLEAQEWRAVSLVAMFTEQTCDGCGSVHRIFIQYMEQQQMVRKPTTRRWLRRTSALNNLPRETLIQPVTTHICADCCEDHGFVIETAGRLAQREDAPTISAEYFQEDINAQAA